MIHPVANLKFLYRNSCTCQLTHHVHKIRMEVYYLLASTISALQDISRISKKKDIFDKHYTPKWTKELLKFVKVNSTNPVTYELEYFSCKVAND